MLVIDTLKPKDVDATACMQESNLRLGLFPKLGQRFLKRYQRSFLDSPFGVALVARDNGRIVGILFGTSSNAAHYRWVMRNQGRRLAVSGCLALMTRPVLAADFVRTRAPRYIRSVQKHGLQGQSSAASGPSRSAVSVLSHIVTHPDARRSGVGRKLVARFRAIARAHGAERALLVTEEGGMGARFFERIGCLLVAKRQGQDGESLREYRLPLYGMKRNEPAVVPARDRFVAGVLRPRLVPAAARGSARDNLRLKAR